MTLVPVAVLGYIAPSALAAEPSITLTHELLINGDINGAGSGNQVMIDSAARRLLYFNQSKGQIQAYDIDTFKLAAANPQIGLSAFFPWAIDEKRHVLFHMQSLFPPTLEEIDTRSARIIQTMTVSPDMADDYAGWYWSDRDQVLYMAYQPTVFTGQEQGTAIAAVDPYASSGNPVLWTARVSGCGAPLQTNSDAALGQTKDGKYLFTVCQTAQRGSAAVARLTLPTSPKSALAVWGPTDQSGQPVTQLFPGLVAGSGSNALWVPNFDRIVAMVQSNGANGWSVYVFDASTLHYIAAPGLYNPPSSGAVSYSNFPPGFGVNPATGRLLAQTKAQATQGRQSNGAPCYLPLDDTNTLAMDETALTGVSVRHFDVGDHGVNSAHFFGYDPVGHNWWVMSQHEAPGSKCNPSGPGDQSYFVVYHDSLPPAVASPSANVDSGTMNIPEVSGTTGANASSDASAYGLRYVLGPSGADGLMAIPTNGGTCDLNADLVHQQETSNLPTSLQAPPMPPQYHAFCNSHGRTATFAHVDKVSLDSSEVRSSAITGDTDRETARDLEVGTDYSAPGLYANAVNGYANNAANFGSSSSSPSASPSPLTPEPCSATTPGPSATPGPTLPPLEAWPSPPSSEATSCDQSLQPAQPYLSGVGLPYAPAGCADNGGGDNQEAPSAPVQPHGLPDNSPLTYPGSARAFCSFATQTAEGFANSVNTSVAGPIDAPTGAVIATADATVTRTTSDGSVAAATSTVKDIAVGGFLHIGSITATATVNAHGRPGTNKVSYSCMVHDMDATLPADVSLPPDVTTQIPQASCLDPSVQSLTAALNVLTSGVVAIQFPAAPSASDSPVGGAEGVVQRQSPGGYLSEVAMSDLDQIQNSILINDESIEKPALVVTYYLDNSYSRNRLVASFAGVAAAARYGIFLLDDSSGNGDNGFPPPDSGALSGSADVLAGGANGSIPGPASALDGNSAASGHGFNPVAIAQAIVDGFRLLLQHPELIPPLLAVWLLFAAPGYLLSRRRALLSATEGVA